MSLYTLGITGVHADEDRSKQNIKYNVVFIVANSLRADHLGCYGYTLNTSPNIDKFAKDGILFEKAIGQSYWTLPSLVSILTSKFVSAHNINSRNMKLQGDKITLAEILNTYEYNTAAFTCGLDTAVVYGLNKGFDIYNVYSGEKPVGSFSDIIPQAVNWLNINKDKELFLFLHSYDAHPPYCASCEDNNFTSAYKGIFVNSQLSYGELKRINGHMFYQGNSSVSLSYKDIQYIIERYDNRIRCFDSSFGFFINELKRLNLYDKTIIVLCADHGEELGERGTFDRFGNQNLYQEVIHVPLIIKYPLARQKNKRAMSLVQLIDVMPTILELLNIPIAHGMQGSSLVSLMKSDKNVSIHKDVFSEAGRQKWAMIRDDEWKLLYSSEKTELYNINQDPQEHNNLSRRRLSERTSLMKEFFIWRQSHRKDGNPETYIKLDSDLIDKLKKAGYW